jgi:Cu/Ag efflux pump CusA
MVLLPSARLRTGDPPVAAWCKRHYRRLLDRVLGRVRWAIGVAVLAFLAAAIALPNLGQNLFPTFKEPDLLLHFDSKPGTSLPEMKRVVERLQQSLLHIPGVTHVGSHIGQALLGEEIAGPEFSEQWITLAPGADVSRVEAQVRAVGASFPGTFIDVTTYLHERIDETISSTSEDLVMRISGPDFATLQRLAGAVTGRLQGTPDLVDLHPQAQGFIPQIEETVDAAAAARYGLTPGAVRRAAATYLGSQEVGEIGVNGIALGVTGYSTPDRRRNLTDLEQLPIDTPGGGHVPLGRVARLAVDQTPSDITRVDGTNKIDVTANIVGSDLGAVTGTVRDRLARVHLPLGYHVELLGEAAEREAAQNRLVLLGLAAVFVILLLLQAAFASIRLALLMFLTLPIAIVGGVLAAWAGVGTISLGALIGGFAVLGIAARNGILMISHLQHLERVERVPFGRELVLRGAGERLSPILMTALATALALLPLVVFGNRPGQEIENPMAIVILGGLATSSLMNLFVIPALYLRFGRPRRRGDWRHELGGADPAPAISPAQERETVPA